MTPTSRFAPKSNVPADCWYKPLPRMMARTPGRLGTVTEPPDWTTVEESLSRPTTLSAAPGPTDRVAPAPSIVSELTLIGVASSETVYGDPLALMPTSQTYVGSGEPLFG